MEDIKIHEFLKKSYGYGYDDGSGSGSGYGYGYGSGYGSGYDTIKSINGKKIHCIDGQPTILNSIHKDVARGAILQVDFTLKPCYIVKSRS